MIRAELAALLLDEQLADPCEQRVLRIEKMRGRKITPRGKPLDFRVWKDLVQHRRHMAGKALQDGRHPQFPLPGDNLLLQVEVAVNPAFRQWSAPTVDAAHPAKRQVARPDEELFELLVGQPQFPIDLLPDRLLARDRQRHVDPVQGHPVDEPLPLRPVPPGKAVAEGDEV